MGSFPHGDARVFGRFSGGSGSAFGPGLVSSSSSLVLDRGGRELVRVPSSFGKNRGEISDAKTAMALQNHCEAERRRRERINMHLAKLRSMVPCAEKLDKAALLAEVINHVKQLKRNAVEISRCHSIPSDTDEVKVEVEDAAADGKNFLVKASLCCDDRPELLTDLRHTLQDLKLRTVRAEISTLGGRTKNVLVMASEQNSSGGEMHLCMASIRQAFKFLLERVNSQAENLPRASSFSNKRRRMSLFESSSSSS